MVTGHDRHMPGIILLTPPFAPPMIPNLGIPVLAGYLSAHGLQSRQIDLNIRFHDEMVNGKGLFAHVLELYRARFQSFDALSALDERSAKTYFETLLQLSRAEVFKARQPVILEKLRVPMPHLEPLPFGYPGQAEAFQMVALAMSLLGIRAMRLGSNVGMAQIESAETVLSFLTGFYDRQLSAIPSDRPRIFGISLSFDSQLGCALVLLDCMRRMFPDALIVAGGSYVRRMENGGPLDILKAKTDHLITGEGERHLLKLCRDFFERKKGAFRHRTVLAESLPVSDLQAPLYEPELLELYWSRPLTLMLQASRGCYWNRCAFCSYHECYSGPYRVIAPGKMVSMIDALQRKHHCENFEFVDDCLSPDFLQGMIIEMERQRLRVFWSGCVRFDKAFDAALISRMAEYGCRRLTFGMESASQRVLNLVHKGTRVEDYLPILEACRVSGISVHLNWIAGLPGETEEELNETLEFLREHIDYYTYQFGQVFTFEAASRFATSPDEYQLGKLPCDRDYHDEDARARLYRIIHDLPIEGRSCSASPPAEESMMPDHFTGWSPFVAQIPLHYNLSEVRECLSSNRNRVSRSLEHTWLLYDLFSGLSVQVSEDLYIDIQQRLKAGDASVDATETLKLLYENDFIR